MKTNHTPAQTNYPSDPERTRTPTIRTGILRSIQLNYGTFWGKSSHFMSIIYPRFLSETNALNFHEIKNPGIFPGFLYIMQNLFYLAASAFSTFRAE